MKTRNLTLKCSITRLTLLNSIIKMKKETESKSFDNWVERLKCKSENVETLIENGYLVFEKNWSDSDYYIINLPIS